MTLASPLLHRCALFERSLTSSEKTLSPERPQRQPHSLEPASPIASQLVLGETALAAHDKALGSNHTWTKYSARVTADALDALGRTEEAKVLTKKYGGPESPEPSSASTSVPSPARTHRSQRPATLPSPAFAESSPAFAVDLLLIRTIYCRRETVVRGIAVLYCRSALRERRGRGG
jgi:hypothetical protein